MIFDDERDFVRWIPGRWRAVGVSRRTWRRWMDGLSRIPFSVVLLARIVVEGDLGAIDPAWRGWRIARGKLWDDANQWHTPATIHAWHWTRQELALLRAKREQRAIRKRLYQRLEAPHHESTTAAHPDHAARRLQLHRPDGEEHLPTAGRDAMG